MTKPKKTALILFDGECNLCDRTVQFIIKRDHQNYFLFTAQTSQTAKKIELEFGIDISQNQTILVVENNKIYFRSDAAFLILHRLGGIWRLFSYLKIIPHPIRDFFYRWIAKNRYRWFGKKDHCLIPNPCLKKRFLD